MSEFPSNRDKWYVNNNPVDRAYVGDELVYPLGGEVDEWFDYDDTYTKYIVKDEFIGQEGLIPCSYITGKGISVSVDANGERVWSKPTSTYPTLTLEDKEVWVDGGPSGYHAHNFQANVAHDWIEDIVALCKRTIYYNFAGRVPCEKLSVARAEVVMDYQFGSDPYRKPYWNGVLSNAPNFTGKFHPSWWDGGYVTAALNTNDYPHDLSGVEVYGYSTSAVFMAKTTNLDYIPHFHSHGTRGEEGAPLGAYTKLCELEKGSSSFTEGQYYTSGSGIYVNQNDPTFPAWETIEVGDTLHIIAFGGKQRTYFRFEERIDNANNAQFVFQSALGSYGSSRANTAFYLYKAGG